MEKQAETTYSIHDLLRSRWSPRAFSSRPVPEEELLRLFEAARWSPSAVNSQPWAFIVTRKSDPDCFAGLAGTLTGRNQLWAPNAPVLVLAVAMPDPRTGAPGKYSYYDLGQAVAHLSIQASALGLHVHQMGGFDAERARQLFEIPEGCEPMTVIAIGYLGNVDDLPEDLREREQAPRVRKPVADFVFQNHWNEPLAAIRRPAGSSVN